MKKLTIPFNKMLFGRSMAALLLAMVFATGQLMAQVVVNENGGFEADVVTVGADTSGLQSWWFQFGDYASATVVGDTVFEGNNALRVHVDSLAENSYDIQIVNENIPLEPGVTYEFSMWARTAEGTGATHFTMGNLDYSEFGRLNGAEITDTWQEYSFEFTATTGGSIQVRDSIGRASMHLSLDGNTGQTLFFDNLSITKAHGNVNGGFESSALTVGEDTTAVRGWTFNRGGDADPAFQIVDSESQSGNNSLAVTVTAAGSDPWNIEALSVPVHVVPGETYEYSVYAKASEAGATAHFTVGNFDFQEALRLERNEELTTEWQLITSEFTVPEADSVIMRAPIHFSFDENVGKTIYIDSLRITQTTGTQEQLAKLPVIIEAESGTLGNEWTVSDSSIAISTDYNETSGTANNPGAERTALYEVTFPQTGEYDLFARVYVGPDGFDDDSFFEGHTFGEKDPGNADDWFLLNGLASAGFNNPTDVVREVGGLGSEEWKWVNISRFQADTVVNWTVSGGLTQTLHIGGRELGLEIDKFAFGRSDLFFTVENLNNGTAGSETDPRNEPEPQDPIAEGKAKWLGNIYSSAQVDGFEYYWNQVTAENAGKWGSVEGTRDEMNWSGLDAAYDLAKDNGFPFRFHILIWGGQQPGWINDLSTEEQLEEIEEWMDAVAERYPDMEYVEVVNEGSNGHQLPDGSAEGRADYIEALGGTGETGHDWIITSFRMARERFPNAKLMINDYGIIGNVSATSNYLDIIEDLQEEDLIDVIGVQSHSFSVGNATPTSIQTTLDMLAETGLPIQATEMDLDGDPDGTDVESDEAQLTRYQRVFPLYWEHPSVEGVTLWGWRPGLWRQDQEAFLIRSNGEERPALEWLRAYVDTANVVVSNEELLTDTPEKFELKHNYPNPFNPTTKISYNLPKTADVSLRVYDVTGRLIQTLVNTRQMSGEHTVTFNASHLASGVYFYRIEAGSFNAVKRMMLIK